MGGEDQIGAWGSDKRRNAMAADARKRALPDRRADDMMIMVRRIA